jgi:hypothetical protein
MVACENYLKGRMRSAGLTLTMSVIEAYHFRWTSLRKSLTNCFHVRLAVVKVVAVAAYRVAAEVVVVVEDES